MANAMLASVMLMLNRAKTTILQAEVASHLRTPLLNMGLKSFDFEILHDGILDAFLDDYEIEAIKKYDTLSQWIQSCDLAEVEASTARKQFVRCLNSKKGVKFSANEHRRKISEVQKGRTPWNKGKKGVQAHSAEIASKDV